MTVSESCPLCKSADAQVLCELKSGQGLRLYWHCLSCDLVFLDPKLRYDPATEKKHYSFHRNSIHDAKYCDFLQKLITPLLQKVEQESGPLAIGLDYGSGPSPVLAELVRRAGHKIEIFDPYFANNRSVLTQRYDFASCCEVVEHMYDPQAGFSQLDAILKTGGILGVMTGMITDWTNFSSWHYPQEATHVCFYSSNTMAWLADCFNWQLLSVAGNVTIFQKN